LSQSVATWRRSAPTVEDTQVPDVPEESESRYWCISMAVLLSGSLIAPKYCALPEDTHAVDMVSRGDQTLDSRPHTPCTSPGCSGRKWSAVVLSSHVLAHSPVPSTKIWLVAPVERIPSTAAWFYQRKHGNELNFLLASKNCNHQVKDNTSIHVVGLVHDV